MRGAILLLILLTTITSTTMTLRDLGVSDIVVNPLSYADIALSFQSDYVGRARVVITLYFNGSPKIFVRINNVGVGIQKSGEPEEAEANITTNNTLEIQITNYGGRMILFSNSTIRIIPLTIQNNKRLLRIGFVASIIIPPLIIVIIRRGIGRGKEEIGEGVVVI